MNCNEASVLIHGYLDGELDVVSSLDVERHLELCGACARTRSAYDALRGALQDPGLRYAPTPRLRRRLEAVARRERPIRRVAWPWLVFAAAVPLVIALLLWPRRNAEVFMADQVLASHIRSMLPGHLTDVLSSDRHTVKPWFAGRLDFSPPVPDFTDRGFPLAGGRLDYVNHSPAAALVYRSGAHIINVFIWPERSRASGLSLGGEGGVTYQGFNLVHWKNQDLTYWAVSDVSMRELRRFARLFQQLQRDYQPPGS